VAEPPENLAALADLSGQWIDKVHQRRPLKTIVLDLDSSESPTCGQRPFPLHLRYPLFVFNQLRDLERCAATCNVPAPMAGAGR
jgi:hypothetical protein